VSPYAAAAKEEGRDGETGDPTTDAEAEADASGAEDAAAAAGVASELTDATLVYVLGTPGCDQDAQCDLVAQRYGWTSITPDELLRQEIERGSDLGLQVGQGRVCRWRLGN
jgi:hypothetical protein